MRFSERYGHTAPPRVVQHDEITPQLWTGIWNVITVYVWQPSQVDGLFFYNSNEPLAKFVAGAYHDLFKWALDDMSDYWPEDRDKIKAFLIDAPWYWTYNFLEFCIERFPYGGDGRRSLVRESNRILEREMSAYRVVDDAIVEITSTEEIAAVEGALHVSEPLAGVREHLRRALELLADKQDPDYRNSIKESISAVETLCRVLVGDDKAVLGEALKRLNEASGIHSALREGFIKIYGYTSDEGGIRHAMADATNVAQEDAMYMLVSCSAFINYAVAKGTKAGLSLG